MPTGIILSIASPFKPGTSMKVVVNESFDEVMNKCSPVSAPTSSLEHRQNLFYTTLNGRGIMIPPGLISFVEEDPDWDDFD